MRATFIASGSWTAASAGSAWRRASASSEAERVHRVGGAGEGARAGVALLRVRQRREPAHRLGLGSRRRARPRRRGRPRRAARRRGASRRASRGSRARRAVRPSSMSERASRYFASTARAWSGCSARSVRRSSAARAGSPAAAPQPPPPRAAPPRPAARRGSAPRTPRAAPRRARREAPRLGAHALELAAGEVVRVLDRHLLAVHDHPLRAAGEGEEEKGEDLPGGGAHASSDLLRNPQ